MNVRSTVIGGLIALLPGLALADPAVFIEGGSLGVGAGLGFRFSNSFALRVGYSGLSFSGDFDTGGINYDADVGLSTAKALLDWHPFHGGFHVSAGLFYNGNEVSVDAKATNGTYTINNVDYPAAAVGGLSGKVKFNATAPYLGVGWGSVAGKEGRFHVVLDLGVMFQGSPNVSLNATCGSSLDAASCSELQSNVAAEEKDLKDKAEDYQYYPVVNLALSYRF